MVSWDKIQVKLQNCHLLFSILLEVGAKLQFYLRQLNAFLAGFFQGHSRGTPCQVPPALEKLLMRNFCGLGAAGDGVGGG